MWEIVICDSDKSFASKLEDHVRNFYQDRKLETNVRIYTEGASFCRDLDDRKMDLIFLNTRLADVHGYELAREIRNREEKKETSLIFLSDHDEDVFEAFSYQPVAYMRKMRSEQELEKLLCRLWAIKHAGRSITVRHQRSHKLIRIQDIMYLESQGITFPFIVQMEKTIVFVAEWQCTKRCFRAVFCTFGKKLSDQLCLYRANWRRSKA